MRGVDEGWIKLHRQICGNEYLWDDKPFARGQAWIDLLMMMNHEDKPVIIAGKEIIVRRGQRITSIRKLQQRWGWSNTKVIDFLNSLQSARMAKIESDAKKTVITIANYSFFQDTDEKKRQKNDAETTLKHTNKNGRMEEINKYPISLSCGGKSVFVENSVENPKAAKIWGMVLSVLKTELTPTATTTWFGDCYADGWDGSTLRIQAPSELIRKTVTEKFGGRIAEIISGLRERGKIT